MKVFCILIISFFVICALSNNVRAIDTFPKRFVLAYRESETERIVVRYSDDGVSWNSGAFPSAEHDNENSDGIGLMAADNGGLHYVMYDGANSIHFVYGLGPAIWDKSDVSVSLTPLSEPSGVHIQDELYAVVFKKSSDELFIGIWNSTSKDFEPGNFAPYHALNSDLHDRPVITKMGSTYIVAWIQSDNSLIFTKGTFEGTSLNFNDPYEMDLVADTEYSSGAWSEPDICSDGDKFYVTFIRKSLSGDPFHTYDAVIWESTDGQAWTNQRILDIYVKEDDYINIASGTNGKLLLVHIGYYIGESTEDFRARLYDTLDEWSYQDLDKEIVFGVDSVYCDQFSLIGAKILKLGNGFIPWFGIKFSFIIIGVFIYFINKKKRKKLWI
jgi:hypothetical protein